MTPKERVIKAVRHKETDYLPYSIDFIADAKENMARFYNDPDFIDKIEDHVKFTAAYGFPLQGQIGQDIYRDEFGTRWDRSVDKGCGVPAAPVFTEETFDAFPFPDPTDPKVFSHMPVLLEKYKDRFTVASVGLSYFERSWVTFGMENVLMAMADNERFLFKMLDRILEYDLKLIDGYLKYDFDCIHINDDYGQQQGLIMGPKNWRKFFKPGLRIMFDKIKSAGKYAYLHSCGDLTGIIPDLIEIGVDILNPFQPEAMDVFRIKQEYGHDITFFGGISQQKTMVFGTPADLEREMREKIARFGRGGGYILAPSQGITWDTPAENVDMFLRIAAAQDKFRQLWRPVEKIQMHQTSG